MTDRKRVLWGIDNDEDKLALSRLCDLADKSEVSHKAMFSKFLNPGQRLLAQKGFAKEASVEFFGGTDGADRTVARFDPSQTNAPYPIKAIKITAKNKSVYSHRDYLGSILSLGIKRELIGDIVINDTFCVVFCLGEIADFICENLQRVASTTVLCEVMDELGEVSVAHQFKESSVTVSSLRVDCVVSAITGLSRAKSADAIEQGLVIKNYKAVKSVREMVADGDILTVRGYGKAIIETEKTLTKKGRIHITVKKYV